MKESLAIFIGGGLGSLLRFGLGKWINSFHGFNFPFGTFVINIIACFTLGFIIGIGEHRQILSSTTKLFWLVGFCGGFSTFSAFSSETLTLIQQGQHTNSIIYVVTSIVLCVTATFGGQLIATRI